MDDFSNNQTNSFNLFNTTSLTEIYNNTLALMNHWQKVLFELLMSLQLNIELKDGLRVAILSTLIENMRGFTIARDAMMRIIHDIHDRKLTIRRTLRAVYKDAYDKAIARLILPEVKQLQPQ